jgi:WhiB family redox-sensing transcriptional regulator
VKIRIREGAERVDIPLRYRAPAAVAAEATTGTGLDMIAVERALSGDEPRPKLTNPEAHLAWRLITSPHEEAPNRPVADLLGVAERTVVRWRRGHTRTATVNTHETPGGGEMKDRWEDRAACRQLGSESFFPAGDVGTAARQVYVAAINVCAQCPVREQCLQFALRAEGSTPAKSRSGVFGGLTPVERHAMYAQQVKASA